MGQLEKKKCGHSIKILKRCSICVLTVEDMNNGSKVERLTSLKNKIKHGNPTYENVNSENLARMKLSHF